MCIACAYYPALTLQLSMTLSMQPSHFPPFPFTIAAHPQSPFPPPTFPAAFAVSPASRRPSRKRGHVDVDELAVSDSNGVYSKRQEIQHNVPHIPPRSIDDSLSTPPSPSLIPAPTQPSSPLPIRCVSPAGSDMSMTDADVADLTTDELLPVDEPQATSASASEPCNAPMSSGEQRSDFYHSAALIRPVLPLPSLSSSAIVELYKQQQRRQQKAEDDEHDPSKQLVLYQPVQPLAQLAAVGTGSRAALRRAQANIAKNAANGMYEWGSISDTAMQT